MWFLYRKISVFVVLFIVGWISGALSISFFDENSNSDIAKTSNDHVGLGPNLVVSDQDKEHEESTDSLNTANDVSGTMFTEDSSVNNKEKPSPFDWIKQDQITVYSDRVIIRLDNPEWAMYTDTNSMDPVIDSDSNTIQLIPSSEKNIHVGDIVAYESKYKPGIITHRVVEIGSDALGWYAKLKGDNNDSPDPGKIRFEQIRRVVVAVIY